MRNFVTYVIAAAREQGRHEAVTELPPMQGEDGKLYSRVIAKAMEAPFPEVALQHAMKRVAEKYTAEGRRAMREEILEILSRNALPIDSLKIVDGKLVISFDEQSAPIVELYRGDLQAIITAKQ